MPQYLTPGVYVEEIERGPRPIEGVPTNTAAFLGETERGPLRPRLVTSYNEYLRWFGTVFAPDKYMPHAVAGFFTNGGSRLYVSRIVGQTSTPASKVIGDFTIEAVGPGAWGKQIWVQIVPGTTTDKNKNPVGFRLQVAYWNEDPATFAVFDPFNPANRTKLPWPQWIEDFDDLQVNPQSSDYFDKRLKDTTTNQSVSALISVFSNSATPAKPAPVAGAFLDQGGAADTAALTAVDFIGGKAGARQELQGLEQLELDAFREVSLVYAPFPHDDQTATTIAIIDHCERMRFRVAVIDCAHRDEPGDLDPRGTIPADTSWAAFYAPWIVISDPLSGARVDVPPGGHVVGIYARTDDQRGVFKAPANEVVNGALDVVFPINSNTQGVMNPRGVNAIRRFPDRGIRVWGARTLSSNGLWKYVSVRRLFVFLENSIYIGTQWVVFEPNDDRLWARVKDTIRLFLRSQWRQGALFGRTEDEAFFITCDRTTMSQDDVLNGRLICEIGIAPVRPAEFVIFRVFQNTAEAQR
jgi:phage tail sheath protein FI